MTTCETREDRVRESAVAQVVAAAWGYNLHEFPQHARVDRCLERRGRVLSFLEVKCRTHISTRFPDVWLKTSKHSSMTALKNMQRVPVLYVPNFSDNRTGWIEVGSVDTSNPVPIGWGNPRPGVANEKEMGYEIPISDLRWVNEDPPPDFGCEDDPASIGYSADPRPTIENVRAAYLEGQRDAFTAMIRLAQEELQRIGTGEQSTGKTVPALSYQPPTKKEQVRLPSVGTPLFPALVCRSRSECFKKQEG